MTDDEANDLYNKILTASRYMLQRLELSGQDDFLTSIETNIQTGKPVSIRLKVQGEGGTVDPVLGATRSGPASKGEFIQRQDFTPKEKLAILVDGLALATIAPPRMGRVVVSTVSHYTKEVFATIEMGNDLTAAPLQTLNFGSLDIQLNQVAPLERLLEEVKNDLKLSQRVEGKS